MANSQWPISMFILQPDPYLLPCYRISPFTTRDIGFNNTLPDSNEIDDYFSQRFKGFHYTYCNNGREAIHKALQHYQLKPDDTVTIFTTSQNFYISSCVTTEIEKFCRWSRQMEISTKVLFVNHEFGYPFEQMEELQAHNLPIIEDCAHSFFSRDAQGRMGKTGDFVIYSFPKMFPLQTGGLLVSRNEQPPTAIPSEMLRYIKNVLSHYIGQKESIIARRIENYQYLKNILEPLGFRERFELKKNTVPGVFMFRSNGSTDLPELKKYLYRHGIQCSVFYGEDSFFIPVHQTLEVQDLLYFREVIKSFVKGLGSHEVC